MPRPKLPVEQRRHSVHYRLTLDELCWVDDMVEELGCTKTEWISAVFTMARSRTENGWRPPALQGPAGGDGTPSQAG